MSESAPTPRPQRIAIIGGGVSGLSAAYFLEEAPGCAVTLYERLDRLGGNALTMAARTPDGRAYPVDPVVYLFVRQRYPYFTEWVSQLGVKTRSFTFDSYLWDGHYGHGTYITSSLKKLLLARGKSFRSFRNLFFLSQVLRTIKKLNRRGKLHDRLLMGEFIAQVPFIDARFVDEVFYPQLHFAFHSSHDDMAAQPCGAILRTWASVATDPGAAYAIDGGVKTYIDTVHKALRSTDIRMNAEVVALGRSGHGPSSWQVTDADGRTEHFDQVILALWPNQAAEILKRGLAAAPEDALTTTADILAKVELAHCRAVIHNDTGLMPVDRRSWPTYSYKNLPYLKTGLSTIWSGQNDQAEVFTSYDWSDGQEGIADAVAPTRPRGPIHGLNIHIRTPPRPALYDAQAHLKAHQGEDGLWFTGSFLRETGYHEDGLVATLDLLKRLVPDFARLGRLQTLLSRVPAGFSQDQPL
jgi:predicted NAD/FAD-binding protein